MGQVGVAYAVCCSPAALLLLWLLLLSDATGQFHSGISLTVVPSESTLEVAQTQAFTALSWARVMLQ